jgi:hypothetical protein
LPRPNAEAVGAAIIESLSTPIVALSSFERFSNVDNASLSITAVACTGIVVIDWITIVIAQSIGSTNLATSAAGNVSPRKAYLRVSDAESIVAAIPVGRRIQVIAGLAISWSGIVNNALS